MTQKRKLYAPPMLIGLAGPHGVGKSTLAKTICDRYADFTRMSFAEPLREEAMAYFMAERIKDPIISRWLHSIQERPFSYEHKDKPVPGWGDTTPRDILIEIGQTRREQDPDYWIHKLIERVRDTHRHVVVDDVYQFNEARQLRKHGATLCWVRRSGTQEHFSFPEDAERIQNMLGVGTVYNNDGMIEATAADIIIRALKQPRGI